MSIRIELGNSSDLGPCDCCGNHSRKVPGFVYEGDCARAAYFVEWTLGGVAKHGASFDFVVGEWGGASASHRFAASLAFRQTASGPAFMVIDCAGRPIADSKLADVKLTRADIVGTPIATQLFRYVDAVWLGDARIAELRAPIP